MLSNRPQGICPPLQFPRQRLFPLFEQYAHDDSNTRLKACTPRSSVALQVDNGAHGVSYCVKQKKPPKGLNKTPEYYLGTADCTFFILLRLLHPCLGPAHKESHGASMILQFPCCIF